MSLLAFIPSSLVFGWVLRGLLKYLSYPKQSTGLNAVFVKIQNPINIFFQKQEIKTNTHMEPEKATNRQSNLFFFFFVVLRFELGTAFEAGALPLEQYYQPFLL
jgi:hypothetical protein